MDVRIDQTGHESAVAQIDRFASGFMSYARPHLDNALAPNQDLSRRDHLPRLDFEYPSGVENNRPRLWLSKDRDAPGQYEEQLTHIA
jgi:hypothetical protein